MGLDKRGLGSIVLGRMSSSQRGKLEDTGRTRHLLGGRIPGMQEGHPEATHRTACCSTAGIPMIPGPGTQETVKGENPGHRPRTPAWRQFSKHRRKEMNQGACGLGPHQESGEETLWEAGEPGCCRADGRSIFWDRRQDGQDYETHRCFAFLRTQLQIPAKSDGRGQKNKAYKR